MTCKKQPASIEIVDLDDGLNSSRMALKTDILDQIGGTLQFGRRVDLFWIVATVIVAATIVTITIFGKKKRRR